ncbi:MAG: ribosome-associated protein [Salibacteraceae bacterium]|jgi:ribosome-associated protein
MAKKSSTKSLNPLIDVIVKGIQEKKGTNICVIDLTKVLNSYADFFVISSGSSNTNVQAIASSVEDLSFTMLKEKPKHIEGYREANWILLDYFDTMVHIFKDDERAHYNLENLWADAEIHYIKDNQETINE